MTPHPNASNPGLFPQAPPSPALPASVLPFPVPTSSAAAQTSEAPQASPGRQASADLPAAAADSSASAVTPALARELVLSRHVETLARVLHRACVAVVHGAVADVPDAAFAALPAEAQRRYRDDALVIIRSQDGFRHAAAVNAAARLAPGFERALACYYATLVAPAAPMPSGGRW